MKRIVQYIIKLIILILLIVGCDRDPHDTSIITTDIHNFWKAYDKIVSTNDSTLKYKYLDSIYINKASIGLIEIMKARNYSPSDYINAIDNYPKFWNSIRDNTFQADSIGNKLEKGIEKLRHVYPELKPAKIYFTIGAFRTGGTTIENLVLIGSEISMADRNTETSEFPENLSHLKTHFSTDPKKNLVFLNIHEYIHTQQNPRVFNILSLSIYEGVAEFVSTKALELDSPNTQIAYGKNNANRIRKVFENEMFYYNNLYKWLDGSAPNEFGIRDLGYYVGYQICENYYNQSENKSDAIRTMIQLDYSDEAAIEKFVIKADYFSKPLDELHKDFESRRPIVTGMDQFKNTSQNVNPKINEITINFSQKLNIANTGIDYGELGQDAFPKGTLTGRFWGEDSTSWTIPVQLEENKNYQILISNNFRTIDGIPLRPYLIEFKTKKELMPDLSHGPLNKFIFNLIS